MATLFLDRAELDIRADGAALALYENGERTRTIPMCLLERVIVQGARTRLDSGVLIKLAEAGVATVLLSPRMSRQVAIVLGPVHNDAAVRLAQSQRVLDAAYCQQWAARIVSAKLRRQHRLLVQAETLRPDQRKALNDARESVAKVLDEALSGSADPARLRGLEGSGARAYFGGFCALFAPELSFNGRNRRPPRDPVNACLSLAYTLLHFEAVRAAYMAGLDPLLGFYHRPAVGRESLACDLIEPLRPLADEWLWRQFATRRLRAEHFTNDRGACLMGKAGRGHFYADWESFAPLPRRWLRTTCAKLAADMRGHGKAWLDADDDSDEAF
jgi:CRISPR-associated protein Cas1